MRAVLLAGGKGTRLRPYSTLIPKPLMPIGNEYSILEIIIRQLARRGFEHITICVNHMAQLIMALVGNGSRYGVKIDYSTENQPLSTIGPLTLLSDLPESFLVMNGDVLCDLDFGAFLRQHIKEGTDVTVATYKRESRIDYGVLETTENGKISGFSEKPVYSLQVSMGVYCLNRRVIEGLVPGVSYGFDNLMIDGIMNRANFKARLFSGFWLDIGRPEDYDYCNENYEKIKKLLDIM